MATLIQDSRTGRFYAQFFDRSRRPQRKTHSLKTKQRRTAERAFARLVESFALGTFDPWERPVPVQQEEEDLSSLKAAVDAYLASCAHLKPKTITTYADVLNPFKSHLGDDFPVARITPTRILGWLDTTNAGLVTRRKYVKHLGYLFRFLVRRGVIPQDPSKQVPLQKVPEQAPKAMTRDEVQRFLEAIRSYHEERGYNRADFRWLAHMIEMNVYVGLRRGELVHLRWEHVNLKNRVLRVANTEEFTTKSSKERAIPLADPALAVLRRLYAEAKEKAGSGAPTGYVFLLKGEKLKETTCSHAFLKFRRLANLPEAYNLHSTRHTFGTWLAERGVPVTVIQQLMGHSTVTTTERYLVTRPDVAGQWVRQVFG